MKKIDRRSLLTATAAGAAALVAPASFAQGAPIRIGSTLALTGPLSATGLTHKLVGDIYIEQLNARGGLMGRKRSVGSALSRGTSAYKQHQDVAAAEDKVETVQQQMQEINRQLESEIATLSQSYDPTAVVLETESLKPTKTNVSVESVALLWLPYDARGERAW